MVYSGYAASFSLAAQPLQAQGSHHESAHAAHPPARKQRLCCERGLHIPRGPRNTGSHAGRRRHPRDPQDERADHCGRSRATRGAREGDRFLSGYLYVDLKRVRGLEDEG